MLFDQTRDQARRFFFDAWSKYKAQAPLTDLEAIVIKVVLDHPEYHDVLENPDRYLDRDYMPEMGETNPFLHMGMHLAIEEQLSIDQPRGIRGHFGTLVKKTGDTHEALHRVMECLAETMWQAQRNGTAPDDALYLRCLEDQSRRD